MAVTVALYAVIILLVATAGILLLALWGAIWAHRRMLVAHDEQLRVLTARMDAEDAHDRSVSGQLDANRRAIARLRAELSPYLPERAPRKSAPPAVDPPKPKLPPRRKGRRTAFEHIMEDDVLPDPETPKESKEAK